MSRPLSDMHVVRICMTKHLRQREEISTTSDGQQLITCVQPTKDVHPEASTTSFNIQCPPIEPAVTQQPGDRPKPGAMDTPTGSPTTAKTTPVKSDDQLRTRISRVIGKHKRYQDFTT